VILACTVFAWFTRVTDRHTDRRTDGRTELRWLRRAESIAAFARKNQWIPKTVIYVLRNFIRTQDTVQKVWAAVVFLAVATDQTSVPLHYAITPFWHNTAVWRTDGLTPRPWLRRAKHSAIARKNSFTGRRG